MLPAVWSKTRSRWQSPDGQFYFDMQAADDACDFFPDLLKHHIGEFSGEPFELLEYQKKLLTRPLFGWKRASDNLRRFRKVFAFLPKGAGKSPWGAGTGIFLARCDHEAAAEVYAVAADKSNARTVHDNAKIMVEASPHLFDGCEILKDSISWLDTHSSYKVLSADASTKHGFRPHGVIFDEMHAQKNRDLYEALKKSMVKRRQPVMIIITHAGTDDEGICFEEYEYAKGVLAGHNTDESCLPVIFEAQPGEDFTNPALWARVNPGHGITVKHEGIAGECREAVAEPRKRNDFLRFHLNRWVNQATAWLPVEWWDACDAPMPSDAVLAQYPCAAGIDMSQKIDLSSAVVVVRLPLSCLTADTSAPIDVEVVTEQDDGAIVTRKHSLNYGIAVLPAFWLPADILQERVKQDNIRYDVFRDDGLLYVTEGSIVDSDAIVDYFKDSRKLGKDLATRLPKIRRAEIGYDPAFATEVGKDLRDRHGFETVEVLQNYKHISEACFVLEALIKARRVIHGGHRLLRWNVENVAVKRDDAGRIRPVKPRKQTKRIDGVVALLIALSRLIHMPTIREGPRGVARVIGG